MVMSQPDFKRPNVPRYKPSSHMPVDARSFAHTWDSQKPSCRSLSKIVHPRRIDRLHAPSLLNCLRSRRTHITNSCLSFSILDRPGEAAAAAGKGQSILQTAAAGGLHSLLIVLSSSSSFNRHLSLTLGGSAISLLLLLRVAAAILDRVHVRSGATIARLGAAHAVRLLGTTVTSSTAAETTSATSTGTVVGSLVDANCSSVKSNRGVRSNTKIVAAPSRSHEIRA